MAQQRAFLLSFVRRLSRKMSSMEDRYYYISRIYLRFLGIWPYQNSRWTLVQAAIVTSVLLSGILVQLMVFVTHEHNLDTLIDVLSFIFPSIFMLMMYCTYYYNTDNFKEIFETIYHDWKIYNSTAELVIINNYADTARMLTRFFAAFTYISIIVTIMTHAIPITLDIILPLNESRKQDIHVAVEYLVDPTRYYIPIILHLSTFICLGAITVMVTSVTFLNFGFHACTLFKLANCHVEAMMDQSVLQLPSPSKEHVIYERIVVAVTVHRRALRFCKLLISSLEKWFFCIVVIGVVSLSINMFRVFKAMMSYSADMVDIFIPTALVFVHLCYLFFGNHIGQQVIDHNNDIFQTLCKFPWYTTNLNIQKLFLFLLIKGSKTFYLSLGGIINTSYECMTTLTMTSISYFTAIYSFG